MAKYTIEIAGEAPVWLVWSNEHGRWWRPGQRGYTPLLEQAGRYPRRVADMIVRDANFGGQVNEVLVLDPAVLTLALPEVANG